MAITIHIKLSGDSKYDVAVEPSATVAVLKTLIEAQAEVKPEAQRLIYSGKVLKDLETVELYKIQEGHTIHLVKSAAKAAPLAAPAAAPAAAAVPLNIAAGQGSFNPLADLTSARYAGYTQLPLALMFGPDGGMGAFPDPEQVEQMMLQPQFQEQMSSLLLNPQMLDFVIQQNPQLRALGPEVREMLLLPMFREMLSNPDAMRLMMSMNRGSRAGPAFPAPGSNPTLGSELGEAPAAGQAAAPAAGQNPLAALFPNGMPPMDFTPPAADTRPPEERYESQLRQLNDMGFFDFDQNVAALRRSGGSVQGAIEFLLSQPQ